MAEMDILKVLVDWGWTAAGGATLLAGKMLVARIGKLEKAVEDKAPNTDLKDLSAKHDQLREDMHSLFRDQNKDINRKHVELLNAIHSR